MLAALRSGRLTALLAILALTAAAPTAPVDEKPATKNAANAAGKTTAAALALEAHCTDDSMFKVTFGEERIEITTPYGKLQVPAADVQRIEFGTRIHPDDARKIEAAVAKLGSPAFADREAATAELMRQREKAYTALQAAAKNSDAEVARRAQDLLDKVKALVPPERLVFHPNDVLYTADSKITGHIETTAFKVQTAQFGEVQLKLADLRMLSRGPMATGRMVSIIPDPGSLSQLGELQVGQTFYIRVIGQNNNGAVWGTDVYTTDSSLAMVAVHAGLVGLSQQGVIKVTTVPSPNAFTGTNRNGVTSGNWGAYPLAFQVSAPEPDVMMPERNNLPGGRGFGRRGGFGNGGLPPGVGGPGFPGAGGPPFPGAGPVQPPVDR